MNRTIQKRQIHKHIRQQLDVEDNPVLSENIVDTEFGLVPVELKKIRKSLLKQATEGKTVDELIKTNKHTK